MQDVKLLTLRTMHRLRRLKRFKPSVSNCLISLRMPQILTP